MQNIGQNFANYMEMPKKFIPLHVRVLFRTWIALVLIAAFILWARNFSFFVSSENLDKAALFDATFNLFVITTGFLATFYTFVLSASNDFIQAMKRTKAFAAYLALVRSTLFLSVVVSIYSLVLGVYKFEVGTLWSAYFWLISGWLILTSLVFINFARSFVGFMVLADSPPEDA